MKRLGIGFGLERIALYIYERPLFGFLVVLAVAALAGFGMTQVRFNDDLRNIFAGNTQVYRDYVAATDEFVDPENELLVLVEGKDLGSPQNFQKLQDFQLELQLLDGVDNVFSLFALRTAPDANGNSTPLVTDAAAGLTPDLIKRIRAHPMLGNRLIAADGTAMAFTVTPSEPKAPLSVARRIVSEIQATARDALGGTDMKVTVTGFPVVRYSIADIVRHDQVSLEIIGALIGTIMSLIVFRSFVASILAAAPAILAAMAVVGFMGLTGVKVTVMTTIVPALVMIFGYADGMHLGFAWRKYRKSGYSVVEAERLAQRELAGACVLSGITTAIAFLSLTISSVTMVQGFGASGAAGTLGGMMLVLIIHGLLMRAIGRFWKLQPDRKTDNLLVALEKPCAGIGRFTVRYARPLSVLSAILFVLLGAAHYSVKPEHSFREDLPSNNPANAALGRLDRDFGGVFPLEIVVPLKGMDPTSPAGLKRIDAVQTAVAGVAGVGQPLSLWNLAEWLDAAAPAESGAALKKMLDLVTPTTKSRFIGTTGNALITTTTREMSSSHSAALVDKVEAAIAATGIKGVTVTGVTVINARESTRTINVLNASLLLSVVANLGVIALAFGGLSFGLVSFLPNMLPILAVGSMLFLAGTGMQFTAVIALTVAFGVAVNDSVHYINRFLHTDYDGSLAARLVETSRRIGPVIIGATLIIIAGVSTTLTSGMPTIGLFGKIAALTLVAGIIGDLIVLPALMAGPARRWFDRHRTIKPHEAEA